MSAVIINFPGVKCPPLIGPPPGGKLTSSWIQDAVVAGIRWQRSGRGVEDLPPDLDPYVRGVLEVVIDGSKRVKHWKDDPAS